MTAGRYLSAAEMDGYRRRLRDYAQAYADSDFLDNAADYAESGHAFTRGNAAKVDDALRSWQARLNAPSFDPDRPPPGSDPLIWKLATLFRDLTGQRGLRCKSRRAIYAELARVTARDKLRENHDPWHDQPDAPGWYRMLGDVITHFLRYEASERNAWYAAEDLAQPGTVTRIAGYLQDQAKTAAFDGRAEPANTRVPAAGRKAQVRKFIQERRARGGT